MSRIFWFTLGALAGVAYASRLIHRERLDQPPRPFTPRVTMAHAHEPTAHEVLDSPFPQVDPARPAEPILQNATGKPPVMLEVTADQSGLER